MRIRTRLWCRAVGGLFAGLVLCEVILRIAGLPFSGRALPPEAASGRFDYVTGWSYKPSATFQVQYGPRRITQHFDRNAIRVPTPDTELDPRAPSMLFVGASFTMGHGVSYEESFVAHLESMVGLQAVNLGVQGFGTDQALLMLRRHIQRFNTKIVVYTFVADHIVRNTIADRRLLTPQMRYPGTKPVFALDERGELRLRERPHPLRSYPLSLRLWSLVEVVRAKQRFRNFDANAHAPLTRALVREMFRLARSHGARFVLVDWGMGRPLSPPLGHGEPYRTLQLAREAGPAWYSKALQLPGDFHPNPRGHLRAAQLMAPTIRKELNRRSLRATIHHHRERAPHRGRGLRKR